MKMLGKTWKPEEMVAEVVKDRVYFEKSGGGITLSGGEPTMQANFAALLLKSLKEKGIHTALDTSGQCTQNVLSTLLPYVDMVLYDIKEIDPDRHKEFTGVSNEKILDNLIYLCHYMKTHETPADLWIRTPVIPEPPRTKKHKGDRPFHSIQTGQFRKPMGAMLLQQPLQQQIQTP